MMSGWITYPTKRESERRMPVIFIPALQNKWTLLADDFRENQKPVLEKNASIGFYCGLLSGQTVVDFPSLTADLPEYFMEHYEARFLPTQAALDVSVQVAVVNSGNTGSYIIQNTSFCNTITVRGSLPVMPPFVMARECRYFGFSPYILKQ